MAVTIRAAVETVVRYPRILSDAQTARVEMAALSRQLDAGIAEHREILARDPAGYDFGRCPHPDVNDLERIYRNSFAELDISFRRTEANIRRLDRELGLAARVRDAAQQRYKAFTNSPEHSRVMLELVKPTHPLQCRMALPEQVSKTEEADEDAEHRNLLLTYFDAAQLEWLYKQYRVGNEINPAAALMDYYAQQGSALSKELAVAQERYEDESNRINLGRAALVDELDAHEVRREALLKAQDAFLHGVKYLPARRRGVYERNSMDLETADQYAAVLALHRRLADGERFFPVQFYSQYDPSRPLGKNLGFQFVEGVLGVSRFVPWAHHAGTQVFVTGAYWGVMGAVDGDATALLSAEHVGTMNAVCVAVKGNASPWTRAEELPLPVSFAPSLFALQAKQVGFSDAKVNLLRYLVDPTGLADYHQHVAAAHVAEVGRAKAVLQTLQTTLEAVQRRARADFPADRCEEAYPFNRAMRDLATLAGSWASELKLPPQSAEDAEHAERAVAAVRELCVNLRTTVEDSDLDAIDISATGPIAQALAAVGEVQSGDDYRAVTVSRALGDVQDAHEARLARVFDFVEQLPQATQQAYVARLVSAYDAHYAITHPTVDATANLERALAGIEADLRRAVELLSMEETLNDVIRGKIDDSRVCVYLARYREAATAYCAEPTGDNYAAANTLREKLAQAALKEREVSQAITGFEAWLGEFYPADDLRANLAQLSLMNLTMTFDESLNPDDGDETLQCIAAWRESLPLEDELRARTDTLRAAIGGLPDGERAEVVAEQRAAFDERLEAIDDAASEGDPSLINQARAQVAREALGVLESEVAVFRARVEQDAGCRQHFRANHAAVEATIVTLPEDRRAPFFANLEGVVTGLTGHIQADPDRMISPTAYDEAMASLGVINTGVVRLRARIADSARLTPRLELMTQTTRVLIDSTPERDQAIYSERLASIFRGARDDGGLFSEASVGPVRDALTRLNADIISHHPGVTHVRDRLRIQALMRVFHGEYYRAFYEVLPAADQERFAIAATRLMDEITDRRPEETHGVRATGRIFGDFTVLLLRMIGCIQAPTDQVPLLPIVRRSMAELVYNNALKAVNSLSALSALGRFTTLSLTHDVVKRDCMAYSDEAGDLRYLARGAGGSAEQSSVVPYHISRWARRERTPTEEMPLRADREERVPVHMPCSATLFRLDLAATVAMTTAHDAAQLEVAAMPANEEGHKARHRMAVASGKAVEHTATCGAVGGLLGAWFTVCRAVQLFFTGWACDQQASTAHKQTAVEAAPRVSATCAQAFSRVEAQLDGRPVAEAAAAAA